MLFKRTDEYPVTILTASAALTQATTHNISMLNEKLLEVEAKNIKLKDELIILREEMKKRRKVNDDLVSLKENILEQ